MKEKLKKINYIFFLILPFIDIITSIMTRFIALPISLGMIVKGLYILFLTIYIIFYSKSKHKKKYYIYLSAIILYILLYFVTKIDIFNTQYIFNEISSLFKLFYGSLLFFVFIIIYDDLKYKNKDINKLMIYSLIIYVILLILPTITNTNFNTYANKGNTGSIGWFYAGNDISSIILILYPFIYTLINNKINKNNKKTYLYYLLLIPTIFSIFIIGTKTSWLGLILITLLMLIIYIIKKEKKQNIICISIVLITTMLLTIISPTFDNISKKVNNNKETTKTEEKIKDNKEQQKIEINKKEEKEQLDLKDEKCEYHKLTEIVDKKIYNKLHTILSGRENKAYTISLIYKESNFANKLFGIGFSNTNRINNCYVEKYIEIDILDILFHYGIIALIIIFIPFIYVLKILINKKYKLNTDKLIYIAIIISLLGVSFIAGHVIGYPTVNIYLSICLLQLTKK